MGKFAEANARIFNNVFICKRCKSKLRAPVLKVLSGKVSCRSCKSKALRIKKKK